MFYREEESDATLVKPGDGWELGRGLGNTKGSVYVFHLPPIQQPTSPLRKAFVLRRGEDIH